MCGTSNGLGSNIAKFLSREPPLDPFVRNERDNCDRPDDHGNTQLAPRWFGSGDRCGCRSADQSECYCGSPLSVHDACGQVFPVAAVDSPFDLSDRRIVRLELRAVSRVARRRFWEFLRCRCSVTRSTDLQPVRSVGPGEWHRLKAVVGPSVVVVVDELAEVAVVVGVDVTGRTPMMTGRYPPSDGQASRDVDRCCIAHP